VTVGDEIFVEKLEGDAGRRCGSISVSAFSTTVSNGADAWS
jgi:hypothetical protein